MVGNLTQTGPKLKRIFIEPRLPEVLHPLTELAQNLWWSWNHNATELFRGIDPARFEALNYNAVALLDDLSTEQANKLTADKDFIAKMKAVCKDFAAYMNDAPKPTGTKIGYFCMEYGLHQSMRLYSGGLGVLAGDYLKEASDTNTNFVAVGLLYRYGYFRQELSLNGEQIHHLDAAKFTQLPLEPVRDKSGNWLKIFVNLPGRTVWAKIWELKVGRISLYLLDTDIDDNRWEDRTLTHQLYGGDNEHRLKQELLLGIGGVRALKSMEISPDVYHCNEGHAAFLSLERLKNYIQFEHLSFPEAVEIVRSSSIFTTHTPVPAGHDAFSEAILREYIYDYVYDLNISWDTLIALGKLDRANPTELFSMSHLAIRLSDRVNGVSKLHGEVSQKMFQELYPDYHYSENHIGYVTNSVHYPTWVAKEFHDLYLEVFGKKMLENQTDKSFWRKIHKVPAERILSIKIGLKKRLLDHVRVSMQADLTRRGENPREIFEIINAIREDALVIGFARRFATYKRANLVFSNEKRLLEIISQTDRPIIFLFAGKAHPADKGGQAFISSIYNTAKRPEFRGKVLFLENYGMELAKLLVAGVDIWLNNPTRPQEASGTSGMKAVMNGTMNFSVLDGWWCEGWREGAGWMLPENDTYSDPHLQNQLDAETIYNVLENDIAPAFFEKNEAGIPEKWISHIKNTIAEIAPEFTMTRMLDDYKNRFYSKLATRSAALKANNYENLRRLTEWKNRFRRVWETIEIADMQVFDTVNHALQLGEAFDAKIALNLHGLTPQEIGIELVLYKRVATEELELVATTELIFEKLSGTIATYSIHSTPQVAGVFEYGFRLFPKNELLAHRQDFELVRWL
jgi:glycogen phosphorylase